MNREVGSDGINMKAADAPFEIIPIGKEGLYDDYIDIISNDYGESSQGIKWLLTDDHNIENLREDGDDTLREQITKIDSEKYGISPGGYGSLQFKLRPTNNGETVNVKLNINMQCYSTDYYTDAEGGNKSGLQKNDDKNPVLNLIDSNSPLAILASGHILFFYEVEENGKKVEKLLGVDGFSKSFSSEETVTIYWAWPENLKNILSAQINGVDENAAEEVREYFYRNPDLFLITEENDDFSSFKEVENIQSNAEKILNSRKEYGEYSSKYNNADQYIGNEIGYIFVELIANSDT